MKNEIMEMLKTTEGVFRINNISKIRWNRFDALNNEVNKLRVEFDNINNVNFALYDTEIKSRDYNGIIEEVQQITSNFLNKVADELNKNLRAGYINQ